MKIVIAGAGEIGGSAAEMLAADGHDVTVIDRDPEIIEKISNKLDIICVEGNATVAETLKDAGVEDADLLMAATEQDEVNMICGISGAKLGAKKVIARIRDPEYLRQTEFMRDAFGLSVIINPELECAKEISRILRFPSAVRVDSFSKGSLEIIEHRVTAGSRLTGMKLREFPKRFGAKVLVALAERGGEAIIPNGDFEPEAGDMLSITGAPNELRKFFIAAGEYRKSVKSAIIMGGSRTSVYLAQMLKDAGIKVSITDRDPGRCERLCELLPDARIICGDATRSEVLQEEGIEVTDAFVALTGDDGDNIVTSLYAGSCGVKKIVTKLNHEHFTEILKNSGLESIVLPKKLVAQQVTAYARAMNDSEGSSTETLHRLADGKVEAMEFAVRENSEITGKTLRELKLRHGVLIGAIIRGGKCIIPDGSSVIMPGDHAVVVARAGTLRSLNEIAG